MSRSWVRIPPCPPLFAIHCRMTQTDLFHLTELPQGLQYEPDVVSPGDQQQLVRQFEQLPFAPFDFHGFLGNRRVVSYGFRYDYDAGQVRESAPLPDFLLGLRDIAARFGSLPPARLVQ